MYISYWQLISTTLGGHSNFLNVSTIIRHTERDYFLISQGVFILYRIYEIKPCLCTLMNICQGMRSKSTSLENNKL